METLLLKRLWLNSGLSLNTFWRKLSIALKSLSIPRAPDSMLKKFVEQLRKNMGIFLKELKIFCLTGLSPEMRILIWARKVWISSFPRIETSCSFWMIEGMSGIIPLSVFSLDLSSTSTMLPELKMAPPG